MAGTLGIVPGDVGTFDLTDGFQKLFNLWDEAYLRCWKPPTQSILTDRDHLDEGNHFASGASLSMDGE
jgi:hypothetical protein